MLGKDKLNTIEVLIWKALIDSYISHDEFVSINNVLREYNEIKKEIKNPETSVEYIIKTMETYCVSYKKLLTKVQVSEKLNETDQCFYQAVLFLQEKIKFYKK